GQGTAGEDHVAGPPGGRGPHVHRGRGAGRRRGGRPRRAGAARAGDDPPAGQHRDGLRPGPGGVRPRRDRRRGRPAPPVGAAAPGVRRRRLEVDPRRAAALRGRCVGGAATVPERGGTGVNGRLSLERGMWLEGLVGGLATAVVAWPITDLLRESSWLDGALLLILVVVVSGGLLRTLDVGPSVTVLLQTLLGLVVMWWRYLPETLWYGLPTGETAEGATLLLQEAGRVLQTYAAPAPTTDGVEFLVVAMVGLTALSVDAIAVTGRAPATAGLPLVAAFMVSVSNTGTAMEPHYFIAAAGVWLLMMAQQGDRIVASWSSADRREAVGDQDVSRGPTGHRTVARLIGVVTVV